MRLLFGSVFAFAIAAAIGLGMTWIALTRGTAYGGVTIGAWTAWPKNGTPGIDPYARAMVARTGELLLQRRVKIVYFEAKSSAGFVAAASRMERNVGTRHDELTPVR